MVLLLALVVGFIVWCRCLCLLSDLLFGWCGCLRLLLCLLVGVDVCVCCRIYWLVLLFVLVVGLIGRCWRECRRHDTPAKPRVARVPKARTEPWVNTYTKNKSSVGAALSVRAFVLCRCGLWLCIR